MISSELPALWLAKVCLQPNTVSFARLVAFGCPRLVAPVAPVSTTPPVRVPWKMYHQGQTHRPIKAVRSARHTLVGHGSAGRPLPAWKPNVRVQAQAARAAQSPQSAQVHIYPANGPYHRTNVSEPGSKIYIQGLPKVYGLIRFALHYKIFRSIPGVCRLAANSSPSSTGRNFFRRLRSSDNPDRATLRLLYRAQCKWSFQGLCVCTLPACTGRDKRMQDIRRQKNR